MVEFGGVGFVILIIVLAIVGGLFTTINQGSVGVVTMFGKYRRIMYPGLNFKIPFIEIVFRRVY
ncbi:MAG: SPFH domain-containing protein, partial [Pseudobdellovibrio sp.]